MTRDDHYARALVKEAKLCKTTAGASLLCCVANWLVGRETFENQGTLAEEFDRICGPDSDDYETPKVPGVRPPPNKPTWRH